MHIDKYLPTHLHSNKNIGENIVTDLFFLHITTLFDNNQNRNRIDSGILS